MKNPIKQLDVVALTEDLPEHNLKRGQVGAVVEVYAGDAYEVEFVDDNGHTYAVTTVEASKLMVLHYEAIE